MLEGGRRAASRSHFVPESSQAWTWPWEGRGPASAHELRPCLMPALSVQPRLRAGLGRRGHMFRIPRGRPLRRQTPQPPPRHQQGCVLLEPDTEPGHVPRPGQLIRGRGSGLRPGQASAPARASSEHWELGQPPALPDLSDLTCRMGECEALRTGQAQVPPVLSIGSH